jgi:RHS repeat-associated protein
MVLNEDGEVKEALMYQPYGTVSDVQGISGSRTDPLRQKFTTKEFDEEGIPTNEAEIAYELTIYVPDDQYTITGEITYASGVDPVVCNFGYHDATVGDNYYNHYGFINSIYPNTNITSIVLHVTGPSGLNFDYTLDGLNYPVPAGYSRTITLARTIAKIQEAAGTSEKLYDFGELVEFPVDPSKTISWFYFGARYLDPDLGIWNSTDPANQFFNAYSYAGGDVINSIDPDGRKIRRSKFWRKFTNILYSIINPIAYFERADRYDEWDPSENYDSYFFGYSFGDQSGPVIGDPNSGAGTTVVDIGGDNNKKTDNGSSKPQEKKSDDGQQEKQQSPGGTGSTDGITSTGGGLVIPLQYPQIFVTGDWTKIYSCPGGDCKGPILFPDRDYRYDGSDVYQWNAGTPWNIKRWNGPGDVGRLEDVENWRRDVGFGFLTGNTVYGAENNGPDTKFFTYGISNTTNFPYIGIQTGPDVDVGGFSIAAHGEIRVEFHTYPNVRRVLSDAFLTKQAPMPNPTWVLPPPPIPIPVP